MSRTTSLSPRTSRPPAPPAAPAGRGGPDPHRPHGRALRAADPDLGASTVEYAMVVLAAAAFGGVMAAVLASGQVRELLTALITKALGV
ncbi:hypothetical protein AS188_14730 [Kocuria flava]|uniref:DUF4244 domain-containing protein n=1 Tax=Kocuria flava TaxID=446860 RepID=A0A0U3HT65_9MICC|nr:DUF4244 domain-containing protein [Kocuria flava]ALU40790.1 hypothetical protein AS188_14730 [Kocuria flava]MCJ8503612.1 DUF4244 domain-containing protein [Kocuria flava]GEO90808.1 hypothetical protein KFL01_01140 [Kocuria flava]